MKTNKVQSDTLSWAQEVAKQTGKELVIIDPERELSNIMGMFANEYKGKQSLTFTDKNFHVMVSGQACNGQMRNRALNQNVTGLGECEE